MEVGRERGRGERKAGQLGGEQVQNYAMNHNVIEVKPPHTQK
jgi:hypothetical protein